MEKIGIGNYRLPIRKEPGVPVQELLPHDELLELSSIVTEKVLKITLRAIERADHFEARHPFWNSIARCYTRISERFKEINEQYPGVSRVIHNSEILRGDILVSDFSTGLNYGTLDGSMAPLKIRVLAVDGDTVRGKVIRDNGNGGERICCFKNEIWFFFSHKFGVFSGVTKRR